MAKGNGRKASALDRLISESVERALATWLSGQAIHATESLMREVWADEAFRRDFLETAREVAKETLDRLRDTPRASR
jgi:hypothetical protein